MMDRVRLSSNFWLHEFLHSDTADKHGIDNSQIPIAHAINVYNMVQAFCQPLRDYFSAPYVITSGWRHPELNAVIPGAVDTSHHLTGEAHDGRIEGFSLRDVAAAAQYLNLPFYKLILYPDTGRFHVSCLRLGGNLRRVITRKDGQWLEGVQL